VGFFLLTKQQKSVVRVVSSFMFEQTEFPIPLLHIEFNFNEKWNETAKNKHRN